MACCYLLSHLFKSLITLAADCGCTIKHCSIYHVLWFINSMFYMGTLPVYDRFCCKIAFVNCRHLLALTHLLVCLIYLIKRYFIFVRLRVVRFDKML